MIFLADHELGTVSRRWPVDPAQVVTITVGSDGHVILAMLGDHVGDGTFGAQTIRPWVPAAEYLDPRQNENLGELGRCDSDHGEAIRVSPA
jgi:hypothetical protein